jgi:BioD-like phosphotransacetylase family protein
MNRGAGKTSLIIGLAKALKKSFGYLKPLGDRMIYREKKMWDYDADLVTRIFGMHEEPELLTLGFEHSKLRYMYDDEGRKKKLHEMVAHANKDILFVEGGNRMRYGVSLGLDAFSLAKDIGGQLVIVIEGHEDTLLDDAIFIKRYLDTSQFVLKGLIFNKVRNVEDFESIYFKKITDEGIPVLGVIPYQKELTYLTARFLAERLFAKVITGEMGLHRVIKNILVGAMSVNALFQTSLFQREGKLVITPGDRADMILAAIESDTSCLVITNNILPSSNIISKAQERNIPMLLVPQDTYQVAINIDNLEVLLTKEDSEKPPW